MSHMKNEAQQAAISACGKNDLQYALGFTNQNDPQIYSGTPKCLKHVGKCHSYSYTPPRTPNPQPKHAWLTRIASS